jgi:hypothetical protein
MQRYVQYAVPWGECGRVDYVSTLMYKYASNYCPQTEEEAMSKSVYERGLDGKDWEVEIFSAKETDDDQPFSLYQYDSDIDRILESLASDEFFQKTTASLTDEQKRQIVVAVCCHRLRANTRHYGISH